jgi:hypothetical protein
MGWPAWVEEIAERYLADEASVFLVYGDIGEKKWSAEGIAEPLDAAKLLVQFLRRSREVVGVLRPGPPPARLDFAEYTDRGRFETLVGAADVLSGKALALNETDPMHCLGRIWRALTTVGTAQGYVIDDTERLLPAAKKYVDPVPGAPELSTWASHPTLRRSNNLVIFLCRSPEGVRPAFLTDAIARVALRDGPARRPAAPVVEAAAVETTGVEAAGVEAGSAPPPPPPPADDGAPTLHDDLERALVECLGFHSEQSRPARVPVMDAVARVIALREPGRYGVLGFTWSEEAGVGITGDGAEAFRADWQRDIALDASAGMILGKLPVGYTPSGSTAFDATGMKALTRRIERLLARP